MAYRDKIKVGVTIGDIHIGVKLITPQEIKTQLYEEFIKPVDSMAILDYIAIAGDLAHCQLSFDSAYAEVYLWFIDTVAKICKSRHIPLIICRGTLSHDFDQLNNIRFYEKDKDLDIYIVEHPTVIETAGLKFYVLPDIYVKSDKDEASIYDYPDNAFDIIIGHGSITETQFIKQEAEHTIAKNIVYNSKQLTRMTKGPIMFGHIHSPLKFRNQIYYTNSFTRFAHGEEAPKGYLVSIYLPNEEKFMVERVINKLAFNLNTYKIKHVEFEKHEVENIIERILHFIKKHNVDRLALDVQYLDTDRNAAKIHIIKNFFNTGKYSKIVNKMKFKAMTMKEAEIEETKETTLEQNSQSYLLDPSLTFTEKLHRFIKEKEGIDIPVQKLDILLLSDQLLIRQN